MGWEPTNRQAIAYFIWLHKYNREANRSDWYTMQLTAEVRNIYQSFAGINKQIKLSDFELKWEKPEINTKIPLEERSKRSREGWSLNAKSEITHITVDKYGNVLKKEIINPVVPKDKRRK